MSGGNDNFHPAFTVPAAQKLDGYTLDTTTATKRYLTLDIRRLIPAAKLQAVITAVTGAGFRPPQFSYGMFPVPANGPFTAASGFRLDFRRSGLPATTGTPRTDAQVTTLLAAIETAITT